MSKRTIKRTLAGLAMGASAFTFGLGGLGFGGCGGGDNDFWQGTTRAAFSGYLTGITNETTGFITALLPIYELTEFFVNETIEGAVGADGTQTTTDNDGLGTGV